MNDCSVSCNSQSCKNSCGNGNCYKGCDGGCGSGLNFTLKEIICSIQFFKIHTFSLSSYILDIIMTIFYI